jgi:germination protein M
VLRSAPLLAAALLVLAGCGGDRTAAPGGGETEAPPEETNTAPAPPEATTSFAVYFLRGEKVAPVYREVPQTQAVGTAAVNALLAGPTSAERDLGVTSTVPEGARLAGLDVKDGTATVDLSPEFESGGGSLSMFGRLAELVFTLTQFSSVDRVWVASQGEPVTVFGSEGIVIDHALTREDFADLTPIILVEHPALLETVSSPVQVSGTASVFEATLRVRLVGPDGETLRDDTVTASEGAPGRGTFALGIPFTRSGDGTVVAYTLSAKDGAEQHNFEVPVKLAP